MNALRALSAASPRCRLSARFGAWSIQRRWDSPDRPADRGRSPSDEGYSQGVGLESPTYVQTTGHARRSAQTTDNAAKLQTTRQPQLTSAFAKRAETVIRPHPVRVSVRPIRLEGVVADRGDALELERRGGVAGRGAGGHAAEKVGLAGAAGAGAGAAERFERIV
jgi:hypothetical protein